MTVRSFKDLIVWQRALELTAVCHDLTAVGLRGRGGDLGAQLRRAANSVGSNIAEGHSRPRRGEFLQFLGFARASVKEVESHLLTIERLGFASGARISLALGLAEECSRMLTVMRQRLSEPPRSDLAARSTLHAPRSGRHRADVEDRPDDARH